MEWYFDRWWGETWTDVFYTPTFIIMPAADKKVTAIYKPLRSYSVTVTQDQEQVFYTGESVLVSADNIPGKNFVRWAGDISLMYDPTVPTPIFMMPHNNISLSASYAIDPYVAFLLTVMNGSGGGNYNV